MGDNNKPEPNGEAVPPLTTDVEAGVMEEPALSIVSTEEPTLYQADKFRKEYRVDPQEHTLKDTFCNNCDSMCNCSGEQMKKAFFKTVPFINIMKKYKPRTDLPNDIIAGFTVGVMQLPQGMAYAMLADLPPIVGLYVAFFPVLIYYFLGTSKHISMGTVAVVSLMTGSIVSVLKAKPGSTPLDNFNSTGTNFTTTPTPEVESLISELDAEKMALAASVCFLVGVIQVLFGVFRLGFVTTYMGDSLVSGFTTGAAVHVFTSQVKYIFGLKIKRFPNLFQIFNTYRAIFENIGKTNSATVIMSAICIVILYLVKVQVNQRFKNKLKIPIPIELIVVIIGTLASHYGEFHTRFNVKTVGKVPAGLPQPKIPSFTDATNNFSEGIIVAVVAFAQSVSLAALMAKKHHYRIDSNQEFIAYGAANIFGSFFSCYPAAASVSRSSVQESAGGKTQLTSVFSACLVLVVILVIGPLFEDLPNCVLSSIIVVALRSMFMQFFTLRKLLHVSAYDFAIWIVTFTSVVVFYVDIGLWVGIGFSFVTVVVRTQCAKARVLKKVDPVNAFADESKYIKTRGFSGIRIVGFNSPLYFANGDLFLKQVYTLSDTKPERVRKLIKRMGSIQEFRRQSSLRSLNSISSNKSSKSGRSRSNRSSFSSVGATSELDGNGFLPTSNDLAPMGRPIDTSMADCGYVHHIILDCSAMCFIDTVGAKILKQLCDDYKSIHVTVLIASVNDNVWSVLEKTEFIENYGHNMYMTVEDAVTAARLAAPAEERKLQIYLETISEECEVTVETELINNNK